MDAARVSEHTVKPPHGGQFPVTDTGPAPVSAASPGWPGATTAVPLLLVPGIGGPRDTFYHQVRAFRDRTRVVSLNLNPVRGNSLGAIDSAAHDVLATMDMLGIERADVLGASFGATVVTRLSLLHAERVRRLVWVAPPVVRHAPWLRTFGPGWLVGGALLSYGAARHRPTIARFLSRRRLYSPEPDLTVSELELMGARSADTQIGPFFERLRELARWDWHSLPAPFPTPLLVIQGASEARVTPPEISTAFARTSGRDVAIVPGHHMPYLSYPQDFNAALATFLHGA